MKKFYSIIMVAASLAVAACQPKELDNIVPDDNPDVKSVKITATIEDIDATKVEYAISDDAIKPAWEEGDELFGFDANGGKFTYVVKEVDATTGEATIEPKQGTFYDPDEGILVYGIYYPGKTVEDITGTTGEESLAIDLAGQSGTLETASPAIMCATATVSGGEVRFHFENQTAIIGLKKIQLGSDAAPVASATIDQIAIEGVVTRGSLSVVGGELTLTAGTKASTVYAVPATSSWVTDENGQIDFGAENPVAFAVLPSTHVPTVYAYTATAAFKNGTPMTTKEMEAGNYYYMSKKLNESAEPVASLTVGGVTSKYYNVSDAFDAADCSNEDCTVKLLKNCSASRNPQIRGTNGSGDITIDLNGNTLTMNHQFGVYDSNITICDNSSAVLAEQGKITSAVSTVASYFFSGSSLTLEGGTLENTANQIALYLTSSSSAVLKGGCVKSDENRAIYVNACSLSVPANSTVQVAAKNHSIYSANGTANIAGGHFDSGNGGSPAITSAGSSSEVTITGGYFSTEHTVILGVSSSGKFYVSDGSFSAPLSTARAVDKEQNLYNNTLNTEVSTKAKYPFTLSAPGTYAALVSSGSTNYQCDGIECAIKAADVNAKATGISNISLNANCTATAAMAISSGNTYGVTLDLNGHTVSATGVSPLLTTAGAFTLSDSSEGGAGELSTTGNVALSVTAGTTTINSGSLVGATNAVSVAADATLTVNNGYFYGAEDGDDITGAEGANVTLSAGWFRNKPSVDYLASGTAAISGTETHNTKTYNWTIGVETAVVEVNEVGYASLGAAVAAANTFDGEDATVTITLLDDISYDSQINLTNANDKPIVLDLNGHELSTETESFITTGGTLTITDNGQTKGKITSGASKVLDLTSSSADVTLHGCKIVSTKETGSDYYSDVAILMNNSSAKLTVTEATIYTTGGLTTISNRAGSLTISDSEISSGTESTGLIAVCNGLANASTTINSGSFYTSSTTANRPVVYTGSSAGSSSTAGSVTINDGYFYFAGDTRDVRASYSAQNDKITINAGYFAHDLTWTKDPTYGSGKSLQAIDPAETHPHATIGETLYYGYQVKETPIVYVAEVNGEQFTSFAEALSTTNAYAEEGDVTLKLLDNVSANTILFDNTSKTIILDLNNYTLTNSASNKYLVRAAEGQTLTVKDGSLSSTDSTAVYCYKGTLTIDNCNITGACTKLIYNYQGTTTIQNGTVIKNTLTSSSQLQTATGVVVNYGGTMLVTGSTIESTGTVTALWNGTTGTLTIEGDSEVSVCTDGTSTDGIAVCNHANYSKNNAELVINSGSIYTNSPTQTKPAVYQYGALGTTIINGGYFYNANNSAVVVIRANNSTNYSKITVNGGFFNKPLPYVYQSTTYYPTIDADHQYLDITSDPESHKHNTTNATYQYGYKVVANAGEASVEASTSTPVVTLGEAKTGGVNF